MKNKLFLYRCLIGYKVIPEKSNVLSLWVNFIEFIFYSLLQVPVLWVDPGYPWFRSLYLLPSVLGLCRGSRCHRQRLNKRPTRKDWVSMCRVVGGDQSSCEGWRSLSEKHRFTFPGVTLFGGKGVGWVWTTSLVSGITLLHSVSSQNWKSSELGTK